MSSENDLSIVVQGRLHFPALFEPKETMKGNGIEKYQATILLPPETDLQPIAELIRETMRRGFGQVLKVTDPRHMPLKKVDEKKASKLDGFELGWHYLNAKSDYKPDVVDQHLQPILREAQIYAGCWVNASLSAYTYDNKFGQGVGFNPNAIQLVKDDTRFKLGGAVNARDVFKPVATEGGAGEVASGGDDSLADIMG